MPSVTPTQIPTPTGTTPPHPIQGDVNCDGTINEADFEFLLDYAAGLNDGRTSAPGCLDLGQAGLLTGHPWGDINCDNLVNALDALYVVAHDAGAGLDTPNGCPAIGDQMT